MSSNADAAAFASLFDTLYTENYCAVAASALFIYETFVTFEQEVACFWTYERAAASVLFFANKWSYMTVSVTNLVQLASFPSDKRLIVGFAFIILQFVPGAVFSSLRAYVLTRSKLLGLLVLTLSLAPVGANLVEYGYHVSGENLPPFGCREIDNTTAALDLRFDLLVFIVYQLVLIILVISSRVPLIVADILLICVTWTTLGGRGAFEDVRKSRRLSLSGILFRNGTIYFIALFILNILHLALTLTALTGNGLAISKVTVFIAPISAILVSRFLLELQAANQVVVRVDPDDPLHSSRSPYDTPSFISSLGGCINLNLPTAPSDSRDDDIDSHVTSGPNGDGLADCAQRSEVVAAPLCSA
ncbi:hypothetical protein C8T65DRAFT_743017 [Cerioporus squamosus]|nr:hypothetical protein C8T65DRAFT_743017 [Cerioporus squamosus]